MEKCSKKIETWCIEKLKRELLDYDIIDLQIYYLEGEEFKYKIKIEKFNSIYEDSVENLADWIDKYIVMYNNYFLYPQYEEYRKVVRKHLNKNLQLPPYSAKIKIVTKTTYFFFPIFYDIRFKDNIGIDATKENVIDKINELFPEHYTNWKRRIGLKESLKYKGDPFTDQ